MSVVYHPGIWAKKYNMLSQMERDGVNRQTNEVFAKRTGVVRKLDPRHDRELCVKWLKIRDEVMSGRHRPSISSVRQVSAFANSIGNFAVDAADMVQGALQSVPLWLQIARRELKKEIVEIEGDEHNPEIMKYIRTCSNLYETENKRKYTEDKGEEGVKWCSAFVNWCITQAGMTGTNNARALSWKSWGKSTELKPGAIVVTQGNQYRHVAFIDRVDGKLKMLGGNQQKSAGGGAYNQVSIRPISHSTVVAYRWPA